MRKPRDYDAELKTLGDKVGELKRRKVEQLGALVIAAGADALAPEMLAGALLAASAADEATRQAWARDGERLFRASRPSAGDRQLGHRRPASGDGGGAPALREEGA
jgi:hypothetical protein